MSIEFLGNGADENIMPGKYHADGCVDDHTLCGITLDTDAATAGDYRNVDKKINCEWCVTIIRHCISLRKQI